MASIPTWPVTCMNSPFNPFPQLPCSDLSIAPQPNAVVFTPDAGPPMARRRSTKGRIFETTLLELNGEQLETLWAWFISTLASGTLPFTWVDFVTQQPQTFRFACDGDKVKVPVFRQILNSPNPLLRRYQGTLELEYA